MTEQKKDSGSSTSNRGFASMDAEKQREIASKGGKNSHKNDTSKTNVTKKNK